MTDARIKLLIVDDHHVVRMGLRTLISVSDDFELVGEAANGAEAIEQCAALHPDVVLMDLMMPVMDGPTAIEHLSKDYPDIHVVALTSFNDDDLARRALDAGALGYLLKDADEAELVATIRLAAEGRAVVAPSAMKAVLERGSEADTYRTEVTEREAEVLRLVARGFTNPQIAERLGISTSTVNFHVHNLLDKLGAKTRTEAVSIAVREGLVDI